MSFTRLDGANTEVQKGEVRNCSRKMKFNACKEQSGRNFFSFLQNALKEKKDSLSSSICSNRPSNSEGTTWYQERAV